MSTLNIKPWEPKTKCIEHDNFLNIQKKKKMIHTYEKKKKNNVKERKVNVKYLTRAI